MAIATLWILLSDRVVYEIETDLHIRGELQTYKGLFFVLITSVLLFMLTSRLLWRLEQSEKQYRMLFNKNPTPMWVFDQDSLMFLAVNEAAEKQYGYTADEFRKMTIKDIRPVEDTEKVIRQMESIRASGRGVYPSNEWVHQKKNGELFHVMIISNGIIFRNKAARLVLAMDVNDKKEVQNQISHLNVYVKEQRKRLKEYSIMNSHKVRKPLSNILGLVSLFKEEDLTGEQESLMKMLERSAIELDEEIRYINNILNNQPLH